MLVGPPHRKSSHQPKIHTYSGTFKSPDPQTQMLKHQLRLTRSFTTSATVFKTAKATSPARLQLEVGQILECNPHPDADKLYVSHISRRGAPLTVVSGLRDFIPIDQMKDRRVVLVTNLKPAKMRGVVSQAMLLAAEKAEGDTIQGVELVEPPVDSPVGTVLEWRGVDEVVQRDDENGKARVNSKSWEKIQKNMHTNEKGEVVCDTEDGIAVLVDRDTDRPCVVPSAFNSVVR